MKRLTASLTTLMLGLVMLAGTAQAQNLARSHTFTPKQGMGAQFETAFKQHIELRKAEKDPWAWAVLTYETGPNIGSYLVRSGGHSWADFDAYEQESAFRTKVMAHWNTVVRPLIEEVSSAIIVTDTTMANWPSDWDKINFVTLTTYRVPPAMRGQFFDHIKIAHTNLMAGGWPNYYGWSWPVSGGTSSEVTVAGFHENWADMAAPSPSFGEIMTKALGEKKMKEWGDGFVKTFARVDNVTLRWRKDLSVMPDM